MSFIHVDTRLLGPFTVCVGIPPLLKYILFYSGTVSSDRRGLSRLFRVELTNVRTYLKIEKSGSSPF